MTKPITTAKPIKKAAPAVLRQTHQLDATGQSAGRLACQIVNLLRGKNKPNFQPYLDQGDLVAVKNAGQMIFTGKKLDQKVYYHYSGYPGGLKRTKVSAVFTKNPTEVLKKAVWNMLPKNKLRIKMFKRLKITN